MGTKKQYIEIIVGILVFVVIVLAVAFFGWYILKDKHEAPIQGEVEVQEYRVTFKVPGRVLELRVEEGDSVHQGDILAVLDAPDIQAKQTQVQSVEDAATAVMDKANNGAQREQIQGAYEVWQQALAAVEIAQKSFDRVNRLYEGGVVTAQKRDEAQATLKALKAQAEAAKSMYEMAKNGARDEDKRAAAAMRNQAKGAVTEVNSYIKETVQRAQFDGIVSTVYPKVGELVGSGSPIMTISMTDKIWGVFNVKEDCLHGMKIGDKITAYCPALEKDIPLEVYFMKDHGSYAVWKATKDNGQFDLKTFEVRARPTTKVEGLRPGMSLILK
ncbi:MAG: efflux RND transporter periplasmic adaptor subunit [Bacteroidaceae bacterium]|nr:efflux RND transporter periplasmic adaptor subunit [Bacteroidaceae bacterium]